MSHAASDQRDEPSDREQVDHGPVDQAETVVGAHRSQLPCPFCGTIAQPVYIHGHYQCVTCKTNIDPCCGGEQACDSGDPAP